MAELQNTFLSLEDFLVWEAAQPMRHEFARGRARAMTGGTRAHSTIKVNVIGELRQKLRDTTCRTYDSDFKVEVSAEEIRYPDAFVDCAGGSGSDTRSTTPVLIVEVLSPSTESIDLSDKAWSYPTIASLEHYLVLWQSDVRAELWSREGAAEPAGWVRRQFIGRDTLIPLPALSIELRLGALYETLDEI